MKKIFKTRSITIVLFLIITLPFVNAEVFVVNFTGSATWETPENTEWVFVEAWGAGGGGGTPAGNGDQSGGGGGGAYSSSNLTSPSGNYTITVGAAGSAGTAGGDSWFNTTSTVLAKGGSGGSPASTGGAGGQATAGVGTTKYDGGNGSASAGDSTGAGGGGAGSTGAGGTATGTTGGTGTSELGGNGGNGVTGAGAGGTGQNYGGGGGGAGRQGGTKPTGPSGAGGHVRITYKVFPGLQINTTTNSSEYEVGETTNISGHFILSNGTPANNKDVNVSIFDESNTLKNSSIVSTDSTGFYSTIFIINGSTGTWSANVTGTYETGKTASNSTTFDVVSFGNLNVSITNPIDSTSVNINETFTINATVTCVGSPGSTCGVIEALARYNASSSTPDTAINTTFDDLYIIGGEAADLEYNIIDDEGDGTSENIARLWGDDALNIAITSNIVFTASSTGKLTEVEFDIVFSSGTDYLNSGDVRIRICENDDACSTLSNCTTFNNSFDPGFSGTQSIRGSYNVSSGEKYTVNIETLATSTNSIADAAIVNIDNSSTVNSSKFQNTVCLSAQPYADMNYTIIPSNQANNPKNLGTLNEGDSTNVSWEVNFTGNGVDDNETYLIDVNFSSSLAGVADNDTQDRTVQNITNSNQAPTHATPILNATDNPTNSTTANLTVYNVSTSDAENDTVKNIIDWRAGSSSIALLNMPFEGGSDESSTKDYSTYGNNGTIVGVTYNATAGYDGRGAYEFTGNDSHYIETEDFNVTLPVTVTAWVKTVSTESQWIFASDGALSGMTFRLDPLNRPVILYSDGVGGERRLSALGDSLNTGQWYHLAATINGPTDMAIYIDGVNITSSLSYTGSGGDIASSSNVPKIGRRSDAFGSFNGTIDELYVFNRSLSAEQVLNIYNNQSDLLASQETNSGDEWQACITPNDGTQDGTERCSNSITINSNIECTVNSDCDAGKECYYNYCFSNTGRWTIQSSSQEVSAVDTFGRMMIAGNLSENQVSCDTTTPSFPVKVGAQTVAHIDNLGNMCLQGTVSENQATPLSISTNGGLVVENSQGEQVAYIDTNGNMSIGQDLITQGFN